MVCHALHLGRNDAFVGRQAYLTRVSATEVQAVPKSEVADNDVVILTPEDARRILDGAAGDFLAHLAMDGVAGSRTTKSYQFGKGGIENSFSPDQPPASRRNEVGFPHRSSRLLRRGRQP